MALSHSQFPPVTSSWSIFSHRPQQSAPLLPRSPSSSSTPSRCGCDPHAAPRHRTAGTRGGSAHTPSSEVGSWSAGGFQTSPGPDAPPPAPVEQQGEPFSTCQPQSQLERQRTDHVVLQCQWSLATRPFHAFHNTARQLSQPLLA